MCAAVRSALVVGSSYHLDFRTILAVSKFPLIYHPVIMKMVTSSSSRRQGIQLEAFPSTVEGFKSCYSRLVQADSGYLFLRYCSRLECVYNRLNFYLLKLIAHAILLEQKLSDYCRVPAWARSFYAPVESKMRRTQKS